jgi:pimeloyl-ACP methyl ester carboxylesterase
VISKLLFLRLGDHKIEYVKYDPQRLQAPTIVFLHEGLGCVEMWRDFPQRVAQATGCEVLVYSRAGYGNSDPVELPRHITFMHDEALVTLPQLLDQLGIRDPILFGHSDGGSIALIHASQRREIRALILEAPHVFVEEISVRSISEAAANYETGPLRRRLERYHGTNVDCAFWGWNRVWLNPAFRSWNIEKCLPRIDIPILVIQGEDDEYGTLEQVSAIQRGCSGDVKTAVFANCGHSPHRDQPERTLQAIKSFVGLLFQNQEQLTTLTP